VSPVTGPRGSFNDVPVVIAHHQPVSRRAGRPHRPKASHAAVTQLAGTVARHFVNNPV